MRRRTVGLRKLGVRTPACPVIEHSDEPHLKLGVQKSCGLTDDIRDLVQEALCDLRIRGLNVLEETRFRSDRLDHRIRFLSVHLSTFADVGSPSLCRGR